MISAAILGANVYSELLQKLVLLYNAQMTGKGEEGLNIVSFVSDINAGKLLNQIPILSAEQVKMKIKTGEIEVLLVPRENYAGQNNLLGLFMQLEIGLENVYISSRLHRNSWGEKELDDLFLPFYSCGYWPYLEFHLADQCNLNCAACEHYSGLVEGEIYPDFAKFCRDLTKLHEFIPDIAMIRLLGGEPLLNKEIEKYIFLTRKLYPDAGISVVTNGLLLKNMPESFYEVLKVCDASIWISFYPPMVNHMDDLIKFLSEKGVLYYISEYAENFRKCQILSPNSEQITAVKFEECFQKNCRNLYDGKLAACFLPFTTKYFNQYFDKNLPEDGAIDLYEPDLTIEKIMKRLTIPFERCRYCDFAEEIKWRTIKRPSQLEDWIK